MRLPGFGGRARGLLALGLAPLLSTGLAAGVAAWGPGSDALNRLYAGLFIGVLAQCLLLAACLTIRRPAGLPLRRALSASHAWTGAVLGAMLFVICLSGALAVLKPELHNWEMPSERRHPSVTLDLDDMLAQGLAAFPHADVLQLDLPADGQVQARVQPAGPPQGAQNASAALAFPPQAPVHGKLTGLLTGLHNTLYAGFPGRILVSLFGFALGALVLGGVLLHPRQGAGLLRLRLRSGLRVLAYDAHKLLGLWLAPLLFLIAATGIFSGLGALATVQLAPCAFPEQPRQAMQALMQPYERPAAGQAASMSSLNELLDRHRQAHPAFLIQGVTVHHWGDAHAYATLRGAARGQLSTALFERYHYALTDLALLRHDSAAQRGAFTQAFIAVQPLHFAQYGGAVSRWLHALAGLAGATLAASGVWLWLARHGANSFRRPWLSGAMLGLLLACCTLFAITALTPDSWPARERWQAWSFGLAWFGVLLYGLLPARRRASRPAGLLRLASLLLGVAVAASLARQWGGALQAELPALFINLLLSAAAASLWRLARRLSLGTP
ncbi:MAG: PepSY-associated TM helix domain-containing protein [Alcaligenes sp.]